MQIHALSLHRKINSSFRSNKKKDSEINDNKNSNNNEKKKDSSFFDKILFLLPFVNEIANIIDSSGIKPHFYHGESKLGLLRRSIIDLIALLSITKISGQESSKSQYHIQMKGLGLLLFSFVVPTFLIPWVLGLKGNGLINIFTKLPFLQKYSKYILSKGGKLFAGLLTVIFLEYCIHLWDKYIVPFIEKHPKIKENIITTKVEETKASLKYLDKIIKDSFPRGMPIGLTLAQAED